MRAIQGGRISSGFSQADVANDMVAGTGAFAGMPRRNKVHELANLYPENLHIVERRRASIRSIVDFPGKRELVGLLGSGTRSVANIILAAYGLTDTSLLRERHVRLGGDPDAEGRTRRIYLRCRGTPARAVKTLIRDPIFIFVSPHSAHQLPS